MAYSIYSKAGTDEAISSALADSLPTTPADIGAATAAQGAKADASDVDQITLTGDLALTLPVGHPAGQVYRAAVTQDGVGGHTVTYGGHPLAVDTSAGASTTVELHPVGPGYVVRYPATGPTSGSNTGDQDLSVLVLTTDSRLISRTDAAGELIQSRLDFGVTDITLGIASDSTANDSTDWVRVWLAGFGALRPNLTIEYGIWSDATQTMQNPLAVLQTGTGGTTGGVGTVSDTFTRTDAELVGDTADTGQTWAGTTTKWSTNGTAALCAGTADMVIPVGVEGDMTVTANVTLNTTPAVGAKTFAVYSNYASGTNKLWAQVNVSTDGTKSAVIFKRIANVATQIATFGALGLTANAPNTFDMVLALSGLTVTATINGVTATGSITESDLASLGASAGFGALAASTAGTLVNSFTVDTAEISTAQKLTVYNGSKSGATLDYAQSRVALMYPAAPDVVLVSSGHNYGTDSAATYLTAVDAFVTALHAVYANAKIVASSQNPQFGTATIAAHAKRLAELRVHAIASGWGYLPAYEAFASQPDGGASRVAVDGVHPTTGTGATGAQLWADTWQRYLDAKSLISS